MEQKSCNLDNYLFRIPDIEYKFFKGKEVYFSNNPSIRKRKQWYYKHYIYYKQRVKTRLRLKRLERLKLPLHLSFLRWVYIDLLKGKAKRFWGIYQFVALPGEGKTLSMVAHMERALASHPDLVIGTNFNYKHQHFQIDDWVDIIKISMYAHERNLPCIIAMDEIHVTFDASDWQKFPAELLALLSFNRKFSLQFLCSAQIYERIPKKIRDIANYTVICKNVWKADRYFQNYYFEKNNYETTFSGKKAKAEFIREFIADDKLYSLYDTLAQVDNMTAKASEERSKRQAAFDLLFGAGDKETDEAVLPAQTDVQR